MKLNLTCLFNDFNNKIKSLKIIKKNFKKIFLKITFLQKYDYLKYFKLIFKVLSYQLIKFCIPTSNGVSLIEFEIFFNFAE